MRLVDFLGVVVVFVFVGWVVCCLLWWLFVVIYFLLVCSIITRVDGCFCLSGCVSLWCGCLMFMFGLVLLFIGCVVFVVYGGLVLGLICWVCFGVWLFVLFGAV